VREASEADLPEIRARLRAQIARAMFPLFNLQVHGLGGAAGRAMRFWLDEGGCLGVTRDGMAMPVGPIPEGCAAQALSGQSLIGILGAQGPVQALRVAVGLAAAPCKLDRDEPQFTLDLAAIKMPETSGFTLAPLDSQWRDIATRWRAAYAVEVLGEREETAEEPAARSVDDFIARGSHRILLRDRAPVAMTGFNAELPEIVQIGGVYTPPDLRGRGYGRRVVALHLAEARARGAPQATLFAASDMAARAYRSLGFVRIGTFSMVLFDGPQEVRPV